MEEATVQSLIRSITACLICSTLAAQPPDDLPTSEPRGDADEAAFEPAIEIEAADAVRRMSHYLGSLSQFRFVTENVFDEIDDSGQKLQRARRFDIRMIRPSRIYGESAGDGGRNTAFWYDGETVTILQRLLNVYSQVEVPETVDEMLDFMNDRYGMAVPTADFLFSDVYQTLTGAADRGRVVGLSRVGDYVCHHLAFQQEVVDWQIWIDAGPTPLPRKFVVTYKQEDACPQFEARFLLWETAPDFPEQLFEFTASRDAQRIEMAPLPSPDEDEE